VTAHGGAVRGGGVTCSPTAVTSPVHRRRPGRRGGAHWHVDGSAARLGIDGGVG
jgi:hypothetical protein